MLRKCIDIHTHVYLPRYINMLKSRSQVPRIFSSNGTDRLVILPGEDLDPSTAIGRPIGPDYFNVDAKIGFMDLHGISHSVISLANPWLDFLPASEAQSMATLLNNDLQELCKHPRLNAFGVLPTLSAHGSILELERISKLDQLVGVIMGTHGLGKGLDDPELEPVFAKASELGLVVFLHPHYSVPASLFGPIENGHAVARLILAGTLDRVPGLKLLLAHSGGCLPALAGRLDSCVKHDPHCCDRLKKPPSAYLSQMYFDAVSYHSATLQCAIKLAGIEQFMFGTDHPFFPPLKGQTRWESVDDNLNAISELLPKNQQNMVLAGNAERILGICQ